MNGAYRRVVVFVASLALVLTVAACNKKKAPAVAPMPPPPPAPTQPPPPPPPPAPPNPSSPSTAALTDEEVFARKSLAELNAEHPLGDVFFELDKSDLMEAGRAALQKNSEWMKKWSGTKISIEGHCDSRGTAEYNLALGDRRASATKNYLVSLGIAGDRVLIVSKGKEAPFCREENEGCWSQNRRGHFIITAK